MAGVKKSGPLVLALPRSMADEIRGVAEGAGASVAFVVRRALAVAAGPAAEASGAAGGGDAEAGGAPVKLSVTTDEDDPPDLVSRIRAAAPAAALDQAVAAAWQRTRARFLTWAERERQRRAREVSDDLDVGLRQAAAAETPSGELARLARSEYPRIRTLVAEHPATPPETLAELCADREPVVARAARANPRCPP